MLRDFIIEEENVPSFRAALMAVGDSLAVAASVDGQFVFLETKVIDQSWIVMWDDYVANNDYPPENRSGVQRRREAIFPFLGQPILHGGLKYERFMLNVFVDKASGLEFPWESYDPT